jgi:hypothetical protein
VVRAQCIKDDFSCAAVHGGCEKAEEDEEKDVAMSFHRVSEGSKPLLGTAARGQANFYVGPLARSLVFSPPKIPLVQIFQAEGGTDPHAEKHKAGRRTLLL